MKKKKECYEKGTIKEQKRGADRDPYLNGLWILNKGAKAIQRGGTETF